MADLPLPSWTPAYRDIFDGALVVADEKNLPRDMMLGLCYAESGDGLQSFDRWHRWTLEALTYIERQDRAGLQDILNRCAAIPTNDLSWGPCHQTWYWWEGYPGDRSPGDPHQYNLDEVLAFRKRMIEDHGYSLRLAAKQLESIANNYDAIMARLGTG